MNYQITDEEILAAVRKAFAIKGAKFSMAAICRELGLSSRELRHRFVTKSALLDALPELQSEMKSHLPQEERGSEFLARRLDQLQKNIPMLGVSLRELSIENATSSRSQWWRTEIQAESIKQTISDATESEARLSLASTTGALASNLGIPVAGHLELQSCVEALDGDREEIYENEAAMRGRCVILVTIGAQLFKSFASGQHIANRVKSLEWRLNIVKLAGAAALASTFAIGMAIAASSNFASLRHETSHVEVGASQPVPNVLVINATGEGEPTFMWLVN